MALDSYVCREQMDNEKVFQIDGMVKICDDPGWSDGRDDSDNRQDSVREVQWLL